MNNVFRIISTLLFLLFESCRTDSGAAITAVAYNLNGKNYIICIDDSFYVPFYMEDSNLSEERIKMLFPGVTTDTILFCNEKARMMSKGESIYFANDIMCTTQSPICDVCINDSLMYVNVYEKDGSNRYAKILLQPEEMQFIVFLKDKLQSERQFIYIDTIDVNKSSCSYHYMLLLNSKNKEMFFVSGGEPNEPTSCTMMSEFILSLVQKNCTNICQCYDDDQYYSNILEKNRALLVQLEHDYRIIPEIPVCEDTQSDLLYP